MNKKTGRRTRIKKTGILVTLDGHVQCTYNIYWLCKFCIVDKLHLLLLAQTPYLYEEELAKYMILKKFMHF